MILYTPFWKTLENSKETTYSLIQKHKISRSTSDKLRHNKGISTLKINDLCRILDCRVEDILVYVKDENDPRL